MIKVIEFVGPTCFLIRGSSKDENISAPIDWLRNNFSKSHFTIVDEDNPLRWPLIHFHNADTLAAFKMRWL